MDGNSCNPRARLLSVRMAALLLAILAGTACHETKPPDPLAEKPGEKPVFAPRKMANTGRSTLGRPVEIHVIGKGPDVVVLMAGIHGDEPAGVPLLTRMAAYLTSHGRLVEGRTVVIVPAASPDGIAENKRHNANGVDINRNFPADNFKPSSENGPAPLSESESRALAKLLEDFKPARIVSIHQPLACIDYDGPAEGLARDMARWTDLPVKRLGGKPGSLGSYAGIKLGIPIVTLELPRGAEKMSDQQLWEAYSRVLIAAIRYTPPES